MILGTVNTPDHAWEVAVAGSYAYVADRSGLHVVDIVVPVSYGVVGATEQDLNILYDVSVSGSYACVTDAGLNDEFYLRVIDVTTPASPQVAGSLSLVSGVSRVATSGHYACVGNGIFGLRVVDFSVPASPAIVGTVPALTSVQSIAISGSYAYVGDINRLHIVDIAIPESPAIVGSVGMQGNPVAIAFSGNYAIVAVSAGFNSSLRIVDITTTSAPDIVGGVLTGGSTVFGVAVSENYAYVACSVEGIKVVDIAVKDSPAIVRTVPVPGRAVDVEVFGQYLYVSDLSAILVMELADPTLPVNLGAVNTPGPAMDLVVTEDHVYVTNGSAGFAIAAVQCEEDPNPVLITSFGAEVREGNVVVSWDVWSDETLDDFTLYRRDDSQSLPIVVVQRPFDYASRSYVDDTVEPGRTYHYELVIHTQAGADIRSQVATANVPLLETMLGRGFPNPFNAKVSIEYSLAEPSDVAVGIYDVAGRLVARLEPGALPAGNHRVVWDGRHRSGAAVPSGVYFYRLEGVKGVAPRKLIRIK